jgi:hypothetical protein
MRLRLWLRNPGLKCTIKEGALGCFLKSCAFDIGCSIIGSIISHLRGDWLFEGCHLNIRRLVMELWSRSRSRKEPHRFGGAVDASKRILLVEPDP